MPCGKEIFYKHGVCWMCPLNLWCRIGLCGSEEHRNSAGPTEQSLLNFWILQNNPCPTSGCALVLQNNPCPAPGPTEQSLLNPWACPGISTRAGPQTLINLKIQFVSKKIANEKFLEDFTLCFNFTLLFILGRGWKAALLSAGKRIQDGSGWI